MRLSDPQSIHFLAGVSATDTIHVQQYKELHFKPRKCKSIHFGDKFVVLYICGVCVCVFVCVCACVCVCVCVCV
jgi:hypothetical protein